MDEVVPEAVPKKKAGRPKGSKDAKPRIRGPKVTRAIKTDNVHLEQLHEQVASLRKQLESVLDQNQSLQRGYTEVPTALVKSPLNGPMPPEDMSPAKLQAIAEGRDGYKPGEVPWGASDEFRAVAARRSQVTRLLLRGVPYHTAATFLNVSMATLQADILAVRKQWKDEISQYDIATSVGETLAFYREVRDINLRHTEAKDVSVSDKIRASAAATQAEDSRNRFLSQIGFYDVLDQKRRQAFGQDSTQTADQGADFDEAMMMLAQMTQEERNADSRAIEGEYTESVGEGAPEVATVVDIEGEGPGLDQEG